MGEAGKHLLFECAQAGCHVVLRGRRGTLWHSNLFDNVSKMSKLEEVSYEMFVLVLPRVLSRVAGFPVASPCLWGKLQNLSFCYVANCENRRKSRAKCWFCCSYVSCLESLVFLRRRRVYGGSWKTSPIRMCPSSLSCRFAWQAWHFVTFQPVW